jgi:hypothetical protein
VAVAWKWLVENKLCGKEVQREDGMEDSWQLLEHIVTTQEEAGGSSLYRSAMAKQANSNCGPS